MLKKAKTSKKTLKKKRPAAGKQAKSAKANKARPKPLVQKAKKKPEVTKQVKSKDFKKKVIKPLPVLPVDIPSIPVKEPAGLIPVTDLNKLVSGMHTKEIKAILDKTKIKTLSDIRQQGGLPKPEKPSADMEKTIKEVEAHAYLELISQDLDINQKLIRLGFLNSLDISKLSRPDFSKKIGKEGIAENKASSLYNKAAAQAAAIANIYTGLKVEKAHNFQTMNDSLTEKLGIDTQCECRDCESAVSPLAYLVDLLNYVKNNIQLNQEPLNVDQVEELFFQPLANLALSCEQVNTRTRQVRIAIEVLRRYLKGRNIDSVDINDYLFEAYKRLLQKIGTSYDDIRLIRTESQEKRQSLADRIGLDLSDTRPDELDNLFLTPNSLTESWLEEFFGLPDTEQDSAASPLSLGLKIGDENNHLKQWKFQGVQWNKNTDKEGNVIIDIAYQANTNSYIARIFREQAGKEPLAESGMFSQASGTIILEERNHSGLSAELIVKLDSRLLRCQISLIPNLACWRLKHLRTIWEKLDHWDDAYTCQELPIIDPDIMGPEDIRQPQTLSQLHFGLWQHRRMWLDNCWQDIRGDLTQAMNIDAALSGMYEPLNYMVFKHTPDTPALDAGHPWSNTTPLESLDALYLQLTQGTPDEIDQVKARLLNDLRLSPAAFLKLMDIKSNPHAPEQEDALELTSILLGAKKQSQFNNWISEEATIPEGPIIFSPRHFIISAGPPQIKEFSPAIHLNRPLIDPEKLEYKGILNSAIGEAAKQAWLTRRNTLDKAGDNIKSAFISDGLDVLLQAGLGPLPGGNDIPDTWLEYLMLLSGKLKSFDPEVMAEAENQVHNHFYMETSDFNQVIRIKQKLDNSSQLIPEDLKTLCRLMTSSYKQRKLLGLWLVEEETGYFYYWKVLKHSLPHWRAGIDERLVWTNRLIKNSSAPVIDPDLIGIDDLRQPYNVNPAFPLLNARQVYMRGQLQSIRHLFRPRECFIWGEEGHKFYQFQSPRGVVLDEKRGYVYVVDRDNCRIQKFSLFGDFIKEWGAQGNQAGQFFFPEYLAIDTNGYIYVSDNNNHRIQKFDCDGTFILKWGRKSPDNRPENSTFKNPGGLAIDNKGRVHVADRNNHRIQIFNSQGEFIHAFGQAGSGQLEFNLPVDIAVSQDGKLYVADNENHRIQVFAADYQFYKTIGTEGQDQGQFRRPQGIAIDSDNNIYVTDDNNRVQKIRPEGDFVDSWGSLGSGDLQFRSPRGLTVDRQGNIYAADSFNHRIQIIVLDSVFTFHLAVYSIMGVNLNILKNLSNIRDEIKELPDILRQWNLTYAGLDYLTKILDLAKSQAGVMPVEWDQVYNILLEVVKKRGCFKWQRAEIEQSILLSPDYFILAEEEPKELIPYRANWQDRRAWQNTLKSRFNQIDSVIAGLAEAVDSCEENTLELLRDQWIAASAANGNTDAEKAQQLGSRLLLDFRTGSCRKTTRVSQAITTLQSLFFSLRNGDLNIAGLEILPNAYFDKEWQWIGSYETWKAAMGVFLYPENILLPGFRNHPTPVFTDLLRTIQSNYRFTSLDADKIAKIYTDYFNDIRFLTVEASCHFRAWPWETQKYPLSMFARGGATHRAYWSLCENNIGNNPNQRYWSLIPPFEGVMVDKIIGAIPFRPNEDESYVYVFAKIKDQASRQIAFARLDVKSLAWSDELTTYEPDLAGTGFEAVVLNTNNDQTAPSLFFTIQGSRSKIYWTRLNALGTDFEELTLLEDTNERISCLGACQFGYSNQSVCMLFMKTTRSAQTGYYMVPISFHNILDSPWGEKTLRHTIPILADSITDPTNHALIPLGKYTSTIDFPDLDEFKGLSFFYNKKMVYVFWKNQNSFQYQAFEIRLHVHEQPISFETMMVNMPQHLNMSCHLHPMFEPAELSGLAPQDHIVSHSYLGTLYRQRKFERLAGKTGNYRGYLRTEFYVGLNFQLSVSQQERIAPLFGDAYEINDSVGLPQSGLQEKAFLNNLAGPPSFLEYLKEAFYYLPLSFALQLQRNHEYQAALTWYRTIYNYEAAAGERKIYHGLKLEEDTAKGFNRPEEWLQDPLNCHGIASARRNTYSRNILIMIIQCILDYADAEFTYDTVESLPRARMMYETAERLLKSDVLNYGQKVCEQIIGYLELALKRDFASSEAQTIIDKLKQANSPAVLKEAKRIIDAAKSKDQTIAAVNNLVREHKENKPASIKEVLTVSQPDLSPLYQKICQTGYLNNNMPEAELSPAYFPFFGVFNSMQSYSFCIPKNPLIDLLGFQAEINLYKLRNCRNIAGMKRELSDYAAPIDILSALPSIGSGGTMNLATRIVPPPIPYRYEFLLARTKELVSIAQQIENAMLAALEKYEQEKYNLLKARQDAELARAGVKLQNLRLKKANDEVYLAMAQLESADIQETTYQAWLAQGINAWEQKLLRTYTEALIYRRMIAQVQASKEAAVAITIAATATVGVAAAVGSAGIVSTAAALQAYLTDKKLSVETAGQIASFYAAHERREQEWTLQLQLAGNAKVIGKQQVKISEDNVKIVGQEKKISEIQAKQVEEIIEFLRSKETNIELYRWMLKVLENVYSYFLQQATATARMAQNQLAFERQEQAPTFIQNDYWVAAPENMASSKASEDTVDRHGLTGSARLLTDLYKLDQYKFETEKRKLQLSKTISLAGLAPYEFQRFRETGVIIFGTPLELFERDFPGHYLRMIKQVRTSVIALIPPIQGIKATLSTVGVSNLVTNNNGLFQTITAYRAPESVALTSPMNATGVFELQTPSDMLLPFEGMGVDTLWEFKMPRAANHFDFKSIADVLITIDYTALDSPDYRQLVIDSLPTTTDGDRAFSFRHQFADQWFDLHNPGQSEYPMSVSFKTSWDDFPVNLSQLGIKQVLLYLSSQKEDLAPFTATLKFLPNDPAAPTELGGEAAWVDKLISTRHGNGSPWLALQGKAPAGTWTLELPNTAYVKKLFADNIIEDILLVITYSGKGPDW